MEHFYVRRALKMRVVRKSLANEGVGGGRGRKTDRALSTDALFRELSFGGPQGNSREKRIQRKIELCHLNSSYFRRHVLVAKIPKSSIDFD